MYMILIDNHEKEGEGLMCSFTSLICSIFDNS